MKRRTIYLGVTYELRSMTSHSTRTRKPGESDLVWLARPSHLIAGALRAGRDGLAAVTISSHLFSTNQMLLAGIPANSIHSLRELSHAAFRAMDFFLAGDRATRHGEDCSGLVSSLKEGMSRRNLISQSARPGVNILSRFLKV